MGEISLTNQNISKDCAEYLLRSIVQHLDGDTKKFEEYANKAKAIYDQEAEKNTWMSCMFKHNNQRVQAKVNIHTREVKDLEGNTLKEGVSVGR